jgi:glycosyltransferase involved in cell wall biosynthesis
VNTVSVILVVKNAAGFIDGAIRQLTELKTAGLARIDVVAVDGGSTDGTFEKLLAESTWRVVRQLSTGLASARNEALAIATGDFIAFRDVDDEWLPGKLESQVDTMTARPDIDVVTGLVQRIEGNESVGEPVAGWTPSACLFRRRAFDIIGRFDPQYRIACDHDWFVRARRASLPMICLPDCHLLKHVHAGNLSNDRATYRKELLRVMRTNG